MSAVSVSVHRSVPDCPVDIQRRKPVIQVHGFLIGGDFGQQGFIPSDQAPQIVQKFAQAETLMRQEPLDKAVVLRFHDPHQAQKKVVVRPDGRTSVVIFTRLGPPIQAAPERGEGDRPIPFSPEARRKRLTASLFHTTQVSRYWSFCK